MLPRDLKLLHDPVLFIGQTLGQWPCPRTPFFHRIEHQHPLALHQEPHLIQNYLLIHIPGTHNGADFLQSLSHPEHERCAKLIRME